MDCTSPSSQGISDDDISAAAIMGFDYALVYVTDLPPPPISAAATNQSCSHAKYTIPPAVLLTLLYRPLFTKLDVFKVVFLITVRDAPMLPRRR